MTFTLDDFTTPIEKFTKELPKGMEYADSVSTLVCKDHAWYMLHCSGLPDAFHKYCKDLEAGVVTKKSIRNKAKKLRKKSKQRYGKTNLPELK